jgi:hypothetical protein
VSIDRWRASDYRPFTVVELAADEIRQLISTLPPSLRAEAPEESSESPSWTHTMRHYLLISGTHKILVVYRAFLSRSGSTRSRERDGERAKAHLACTEAADFILQELENGSSRKENSQALWTLPYHCLAAAVVLALDMFASAGRPEADVRRRSVLRAKVALERLAPTSRIARRGLQVCSSIVRAHLRS